MGGARGTYGSGKMHAVLWLESLKERGYLEDLDLYWRQILERILQKWDRRQWTGFVCLRIATNMGLLLTK
jgi:hypothetical protein